MLGVPCSTVRSIVTLLRELQANAVSDGYPITSLLRQCTVLAARLQHEPLRTWAARELEGYPAGVELPTYRKRFATQVLGDFSGPMGSGVKNAELPPGLLPSQLAELKEHLYFAETRQGVAEIEQLLASGEHVFQIPWPADVVVAVQSNYYEYMALQRAWQVVPATSLKACLSGIRDKVLQFALEIERQAPDAGEAAVDEIPVAEPVVSQIFNQTFYGSHATVAMAGRDATQAVSFDAVNTDTLRAAVIALGVPVQESAELVAAIEGDESEGATRPGPRTRQWLERLRARTIPVATGVATSTVTAVVLHELGLK
ncbi:MAG TPA: hypothetical protein VFL73_06415 [Solirubrobacteraceae bacterium]|nr:hypothetical protein [Solirubrobacteraceae bacterium]